VRQRPGLHSPIQAHHEDDLLGAVRPGRWQRREAHAELTTGEPETRKQAIDFAREPRRRYTSLLGQFSGGGRQSLIRSADPRTDGTQVNLSRIEQVELGSSRVVRGEDVGQCRAVLPTQVLKQVTPPLEIGQPAGIFGEAVEVLPRAPRQLVECGVCAVEQLTPTRRVGIEAFQRVERALRTIQA
jgi:hypothetical protein